MKHLKLGDIKTGRYVDMPNEIWELIFSYNNGDIKILRNVRLTCRQFNECVLNMTSLNLTDGYYPKFITKMNLTKVYVEDEEEIITLFRNKSISPNIIVHCKSATQINALPLTLIVGKYVTNKINESKITVSNVMVDNRAKIIAFDLNNVSLTLKSIGYLQKNRSIESIEYVWNGENIIYKGTDVLTAEERIMYLTNYKPKFFKHKDHKGKRKDTHVILCINDKIMKIVDMYKIFAYFDAGEEIDPEVRMKYIIGDVVTHIEKHNTDYRIKTTGKIEIPEVQRNVSFDRNSVSDSNSESDSDSDSS